MESLKKNGFMVGLIVMIVVIGLFAYFVSWSWGISKYNSLQKEISKNQATLDAYAKMDPKDLPTEWKVKNDSEFLKKLQGIFAEVEKFYKERVDKLTRLQLVKGGETFVVGDDAAFSSAFNTALDELNKKYADVRVEYVKRVYPAHVAQNPELVQSLPKITLTPTISGKEADLIEAAQMCRVTAAIIAAATEAKWGGLTAVVFEKKKTTRPSEESSATRPKAARTEEAAEETTGKARPKRATGGAAAKKKEPEVKAVAEFNPRDLYERVKVTVAGEIRFEDVGPFLNALELRANDPEDPVYFVVDDFVLTKQKDRLLKPFYQAQDAFQKLDDAKRVPLDHEVKLPPATLRLTLSVLKYRGFAQ